MSSYFSKIYQLTPFVHFHAGRTVQGKDRIVLTQLVTTTTLVVGNWKEGFHLWHGECHLSESSSENFLHSTIVLWGWRWVCTSWTSCPDSSPLDTFLGPVLTVYLRPSQSSMWIRKIDHLNQLFSHLIYILFPFPSRISNHQGRWPQKPSIRLVHRYAVHKFQLKLSTEMAFPLPILNWCSHEIPRNKLNIKYLYPVHSIFERYNIQSNWMNDLILRS